MIIVTSWSELLVYILDSNGLRMFLAKIEHIDIIESGGQL